MSEPSTFGDCGPIPLKNYQTGEIVQDYLHCQVDRPLNCSENACLGSHIDQWDPDNVDCGTYSKPELIKKASDFLKDFYTYNGREKEYDSRWAEVLDQIESSETYDLTSEELEYGVRMGWRNSPRCPGRVQWKNFTLIDRRYDCDTTDQMFEAICDHVKIGTNQGIIKPTITIFRQRKKGQKDLRIWSFGLFNYACYKFIQEPNKDGELPKKITLGDRANYKLTKFCESLGWKGNNREFDVLPIVLSSDGNPKYYQLPDEIINKVQIKHPTIKAIDDLNLQWFGVPMVCGMLFEVGGIKFPAAPFNGWFVSVEILRNILEPSRYALEKKIGDAIGCNTSNNLSLWKDTVALELNSALLHSFTLAGVTFVDQHTISEQFADHFKNEMKERGGCPTDWVWVVPCQSGSLTPLFHQEFLNYHLSPSYEKQDNLWETHLRDISRAKKKRSMKSVAMVVKYVVNWRKRSGPYIRLFFATETGTARRFAYRLKHSLSRCFNVELISLEKFNKDLLIGMCLFVVATAGEGDAPTMANDMTEWLREEMKISNTTNKAGSTGNGLLYGVFGLGNSSYEYFCGYGKWLDESLNAIGGTRMLEIGLGDELEDRDTAFKEWTEIALEQMGSFSGVPETDRHLQPSKKDILRWTNISNSEPTRPYASGIDGAAEQLSLHHNKTVVPACLVGRTWLCKEEDQKSILVQLEIPNPQRIHHYEPGDHALIFPNNSEEDVAFMMNHLVDAPEDPNMLIKLQEYQEEVGWEEASTDIPPACITDIFRYHVSLYDTPSQELLEYLSLNAKNEHEAKQLGILSKDQEAFKDWEKQHLTVVDTFKKYPSIKVATADLVYKLPQLHPRYYSIASSPRYVEESLQKPQEDILKLDLVVSVVEFKTDMGNIKKGFCSNFLADLNIGSKVPLYMIYNPGFHWKRTLENPAPCLLIGTGSGIAPFRGFWQEEMMKMNGSSVQENWQEMEGSRTGDQSVYFVFGCKNRNGDLLSEETDKMKTFLSRTDVFSREGSREYVQHRIAKESKKIYELLVIKNAYVYICGRTEMADGVHEALIKVIDNHRQGDVKSGKDFVKKMRDDGRYSRDVYGYINQKVSPN